MTAKYSVMANFLIYYLILHTLNNAVMNLFCPQKYIWSCFQIIVCQTAFSKTGIKLHSYQQGRHRCLSYSILTRFAVFAWFSINSFCKSKKVLHCLYWLIIFFFILGRMKIFKCLQIICIILWLVYSSRIKRFLWLFMHEAVGTGDMSWIKIDCNFLKRGVKLTDLGVREILRWNVSSSSLWWTGRPGVLQSTVSQRVGHDWETELITKKWGEWADVTGQGQRWGPYMI